ncbi:Nuclease subunit of the excinuclease complex [Variovorax sp. PBL-H6]|uniref:GIY-YIG nuclease family protein n=1 Tax=Variovorax sp. PBL-H6 TaxID=434009 RepID=UPI0013193291|nr:GIY-YIG nuclease family protein [Variovorax sp. PBL-H6]VTU22328.1 Nuclease subunit of the excinuclease complex [Variovorax sp. PBL-H6]
MTDNTASADAAAPAMAHALKTLPPLADQIVDKAIDNMTRKLVAGFRNKNNAKPNAKSTDYAAEGKEAFKAASAESVMQVANRGQAWKELVQKSLSAGISSIATLRFDGEFKITGGQRPDGFDNIMPSTPGVYVVHDDRTGKPVYIGDSENMRQRWHAGHFNEYRQGQRPSGERYKLADEFENGCTVKFIKMDSKESAAALEAHLIRESNALDAGMLKNKREELLTEQGSRSNQEAKKLKDASGTTASLVKGAAGEALKNVGHDVFQQLTTAAIKAVKDELIDIFAGGKAKIAARVKRLLTKVFAVLQGVLDDPLKLLRGLVEFIVNALSKAIGQVYNLARNLFDIGNGAWNLYRGANTMSREELVRKISETVIVSGSLVVWDALEPVIESHLGMLGPFAPYVSCAVVAIGFGLSSYALQKIVTRIIDAIVAFKQGFLDSMEAARAACEQLVRNAEKELEMMADLRDYVASTMEVMDQMRAHTATLSLHRSIQPLDVHTLLSKRSQA